MSGCVQEGGHEWLGVHGGHEWLGVHGGHEWLGVHGGHVWLGVFVWLGVLSSKEYCLVRITSGYG